MRHLVLTVCLLLAIATARDAGAIAILLDYALDTQNENWFDVQSPAGLMRRNAVDAAAGFLSSIITNDDWQSLSTLNEAFTLSDIAASTIFDLDGNPLVGTAESDGAGYAYANSSNDIDTTNRSSVGANEYVVYVGAFAFDAGSSANAKGGWDSNDRRNAAGVAGIEFNTWGGSLYFNTTKNWYAGSNPGIDPTDGYGVQDPNKNPATDISSDNWDWSTASDTWKGFDLRTIDSTASGKTDLYATAIHELMHALGATTSAIQDYVGVDTSGDFIGTNLMQAFGGPVPGEGGHFAENIQSLVWGSDDIVSEVVLDPNSLSGVRKYFTQLDAALLRDLGYDVLNEFAPDLLAGDYNEDGVVDAADYTVWRDNLGATLMLPGDTTPGTVTQPDYDVWRSQFGQAAAAEDFVGAVPEPSLHLMVSVGSMILLACRRSKFGSAAP